MIFSIKKSFWNTNKNDWQARIKQIDTITNQNKRLDALTNKDDQNIIYKEIFDKLVKEKVDGIKD